MTALPPVRRRLVGAALRRYRQYQGYDLDDAARILDCDRSKISRIETGQRGIRNRELRELLTEYGLDKPAQDVLAAIAAPRGAGTWRRACGGQLPDVWPDLMALEATASKILIYEAQRVPELRAPRGALLYRLLSGRRMEEMSSDLMPYRRPKG